MKTNKNQIITKLNVEHIFPPTALFWEEILDGTNALENKRMFPVSWGLEIGHCLRKTGHGHLSTVAGSLPRAPTEENPQVQAENRIIPS